MYQKVNKQTSRSIKWSQEFKKITAYIVKVVEGKVETVDTFTVC